MAVSKDRAEVILDVAEDIGAILAQILPPSAAMQTKAVYAISAAICSGRIRHVSIGEDAE